MRYGGDAERPRVEREYRKLMQLEPREEGHVISLGEYWWSTGDRAKARQTWRRLRTMGAGPGAGQLALAEVLSDHGLVTEARAAFEAALRLPGKDLIRGAGGVAAGIPEKLAKETLSKFRPSGLTIVRAGGVAGTFELTDLGLADAPKSVAIADSSVDLAGHVGHKVEITGTTVAALDAAAHTMSISGMKHLAASCP